MNYEHIKTMLKSIRSVAGPWTLRSRYRLLYIVQYCKTYRPVNKKNLLHGAESVAGLCKLQDHPFLETFMNVHREEE